MRKVGRLVLHVVLAGLISGTLQMAWAEETAPRGQTIEERLEALEQKQKILERNRELEKEAEQEKAKSAVVAGAGKNGFTLSSADKSYQLKVSGYAQADGRFYFDDDAVPATNTFLIRRARLIFDGRLVRYVGFRVQPDFGQGRTTLFDAYLVLQFRPEANLLVGKAKTPYGLERLQSALDRRFVELAFPDGLTPNRDVGVQFAGDALGGSLSYALAVLNGVVDGSSGDADTDDDKDYAARIFAHPFKHTGIGAIEGLGLGVATTYGDQQGTVSAPNLPSFKTQGQLAFFSYLAGGGTDNTVRAEGERFRFSPQGYYHWGPFGLLGEYARTRQDVRMGAAIARLTNTAWQLSAYYVLTGEKASFKRVNPAKPFDPGKGHWGAFEVAARYSELRVDDKTFPTFANIARSAKEARAWAAGLNWYPNPNVRVLADYGQTLFDGGAPAGGDREKEKVLLTRFEVAY